MNRKYRLKIIYPISEEHFRMVEGFRKDKLDGEIINSRENNINFIPKSWLTEIKEPLTKENSWKELDPYPGADSREEFYYLGWSNALENQKLGQVVDEEKDEMKLIEYFQGDFKLHDSEEEIHIQSARKLWIAALKYARGL